MWEALTDRKCEEKPAALVHPLIRLDGKYEVQGVVWVREFGLHRAG